jgi:hypothetical protein
MAGHIEQGKITLNVVMTILGKQRQKIILPYGYVTEPRYLFQGPYVWQELSGTNNLFLCTILSNAQDNTISLIHGITEAAIEVVAVQNLDDPKVQEMENICKLYRLKNDTAIP